MKGLIRRDFSVAISNFLKTYIIIYMIFVGLYIVTRETFFLLYIIGTEPAFTVNIMSIDEKDGWTRYSSTLPYSRKELVCSKYIVGLCILAGITAIIMVIMAVMWGIGNEFNFALHIGSTIGFWAIGVFITSLMIPIFYKFGLEKMQILLIIFIVVIAIVGGTFLETILMKHDGAQIMQDEMLIVISSLIAFSVSLVIYYLSYRVSAKIFEAKEL